MRGKWTVPGDGTLPSSHLMTDAEGYQLRCGRRNRPNGDYTYEPPATGKTCESCLRLSRRDG